MSLDVLLYLQLSIVDTGVDSLLLSYVTNTGQNGYMQIFLVSLSLFIYIYIYLGQKHSSRAPCDMQVLDASLYVGSTS